MKLLTSFAAKWVAKILYLVGVITDSRQKSIFFLSFHVLRLFCTVFFLAVALVIFLVCLFVFGYTLRCKATWHEATWISKVKISVLPCFNPKVKVNYCEVLANKIFTFPLLYHKPQKERNRQG